MSTGSQRRKFSNFECRKNCYLNLRAPKFFVDMQLVSKISFWPPVMETLQTRTVRVT
jgi:hypothetical protein